MDSVLLNWDQQATPNNNNYCKLCMDHRTVFVDVGTSAALQLNAATKVYNYKKVDWQEMTEDLKNLSLPDDNIQQQWDCFGAKLQQMICFHVPSHKAKSTRQTRKLRKHSTGEIAPKEVVDELCWERLCQITPHSQSQSPSHSL